MMSKPRFSPLFPGRPLKTARGGPGLQWVVSRLLATVRPLL